MKRKRIAVAGLVAVVLSWRAAAYLDAPAAVALLLVPVALFAPSADLRPAVGFLLLIANVLSLTAGLIFLIKPFLVDRKTRRSARLDRIAAGVFCGSALALLGAGGVLPGLPEAWNLALGIVPVVLATGLVFAGSTLSPGE